MAKGIPQGKWSTMQYDVIERVVQMMTQSVLDIKSEWAVETEPELLERMTYEKFLDMLQKADASEESYQQFKETLAAALTPLIQQAFAPPVDPNAPQQGAPNGR